jgi:hypothetical protein
LFVEANAISPQRMVAIAAAVAAAGATVVDAAIIGPPPDADRQARVYLSGPLLGVDVVHRLFNGGPAVPRRVDERLGSASALKMAYGSFQKASRALAAVSHALADEFGVTGLLLAEAVDLGTNALADREHVAGVAPRGWRWAPEMAEVADTLAALGLPTGLVDGAAGVFERWVPDKDRWDIDADTALRHLRAGGEPGSPDGPPAL